MRLLNPIFLSQTHLAYPQTAVCRRAVNAMKTAQVALNLYQPPF